MATPPKLPSLGEDARSVKDAAENESVSPVERTGKPRAPLSDGPKMGEKGEYLPARYPAPDTEVVLPNGSVQKVTGRIIEDR